MGRLSLLVVGVGPVASNCCFETQELVTILVGLVGPNNLTSLCQGEQDKWVECGSAGDGPIPSSFLALAVALLAPALARVFGNYLNH